MSVFRVFAWILMLGVAVPIAWAEQVAFPNPAIDMTAYLHGALAAAAHREARRLSENEFIRMSTEPGSVLLDARSPARYGQLHLRGAVNLDFSDFTIASLERLIPDRNTPILIHCNNNFINADAAFPTKLPVASLNISTYIALYNHGYRNVYELGPTLDVRSSRLPFEGAMTTAR